MFIYVHVCSFMFIYVHLCSFMLRKPASWLVAVCERSENRGCGGGGCRKGTKSRRAPVLSARKRSILLDYVPLGNLLMVGYRFPLGPPFWWPERPWGCIGKYNETAGKHDNDQRKSYKIPWKTDENGANARNKPWKIPWKMEETGANARRKPWRYSKHAGKYSESAGKCDNNERKWCKKDRKMKETGKTLGLILILKRYENAGNQRKWCKNLWRKEVKMIGNM